MESFYDYKKFYILQLYIIHPPEGEKTVIVTAQNSGEIVQEIPKQPIPSKSMDRGTPSRTAMNLHVSIAHE